MHKFWLVAILLLFIPFNAHAQGDSVRPIEADDVDNLKILTLLDAHEAPVFEMAFSSETRAFATTSVDGQLCVWNVRALGQRPGQLRLCLTDYLVGVSRFAITPDGRQLAVAFEHDIVLFSVATPQPQAPAPQGIISAGSNTLLDMQYLSDTLLLTVDVNEQLRLFDLDLNANLFTQTALEWSVFDDTLYVLDELGRLLLVDLSDGIVKDVLDVEADHFLASEDWILTWGDETQLWQHGEFDEPEFELDTVPDGANYVPQRPIVVTWEGETATFWSLETGDIIQTIRDNLSGVRTVAFNVDGTWAVSIDGRARARLWLINSQGAPVLNRWLDGAVDGVLVSPDNGTLVTTRENFAARFYDFVTGRLRGNIELSTQVLFSPDWTLIANANGSLVTWIGLRDDPRSFALMPFAYASGLIDVRETPSQDLPRSRVLQANDPVFALGLSENEEWVKIQLSDDTTGWVVRSGVYLAEGSEWNDLEVVE